MAERNIFERDRSGEQIWLDDPDYPRLKEMIDRATVITAKINTTSDAEEARRLFSELIGSELDETSWFIPPFYTDLGMNIKIGKGVFINHACTFMDRGGIAIGDGVLIAPKVNLITIGHPEDPNERRSTISKPISIGRNAWIGINSTILPGITVGENSIIAAGSVVTRDVPPNVVVAGVPAKVIREIRSGR